MKQFASQDPRSYSLYFELNIWFRARKVTGTFEKRAPGSWLKARDGRGTRAAALVSRVSLNARAYALPLLNLPLTKSEEKERLLAVYTQTTQTRVVPLTGRGTRRIRFNQDTTQI